MRANHASRCVAVRAAQRFAERARAYRKAGFRPSASCGSEWIPRRRRASICVAPSASMGVVSTASSSAFDAPNARRRSRRRRYGQRCFVNAHVHDRHSRARGSAMRALRCAVVTSSGFSGSKRNSRQRLTIAGVMAIIGFSVVEPMKRITPCSIAGRIESDCALRPCDGIRPAADTSAGRSASADSPPHLSTSRTSAHAAGHGVELDEFRAR